MIKGMELAAEPGRKILSAVLGNRRAGYSDLGEVRTVLTDCGARSYIEKLARDEVEQALSVIAELGLTAEVEGELRRLSKFSISRHT